MAQVSEQITVTVTGANHNTYHFNVLVDTVTGNAVSNPLSIPLSGANSGTDNIIATMPSHAGVAPSNQADIVWQATNGLIAVGPVTVKFYLHNTANKSGWFPSDLVSYPSGPSKTTTINSLVFNTVSPNVPISGTGTYSTNIGQGGAYKTQPMAAQNQTSAGAFAGNVPVSTQNNGNNGSDQPGFQLDITGNFVVKDASQTFTFYISNCDVGSFALYIGGGATCTSSGNAANVQNPYPGTAPNGVGYPLMVANANGKLALQPNTTWAYIKFPAPGIYPFYAIYNQFDAIQFSGDDNGYFQITYGQGQLNTGIGNNANPLGVGAQNLPVSSISTAPTSTTPSGSLQLTPSGGSTNLKVQGQSETLSLSVTGIQYTTIPYVPVLEGTSGSVPLYDNVGNTFNFGGVVYPPSGGTAPDYTSALSAGQTGISGDNTAWQGLLSIAPYPSGSPTALSLAYNGASPTSHVDVTNLTIKSEDIAWFNSSNKKYDLFATSASGGGNLYPIQVAYMVHPTLGSLTVAPLTMPADGASHSLTISLAKPMSPEQQGLFGTGNSVAIAGSLTNGATFASQLTPVLDGSGWLTGWTTSITVPHSTTNSSFQLNLNCTGVLTYLSGTSFVNAGAITYFNGTAATIATTGVTYQNPTNYSFAITGGVSGTTITGSITLTAVVFSKDNGTFNQTSPGTNFFRIHSGTKTSLGTPTIGAPVAVSGGYHTTISQTVTSLYAWGTPLTFGYTATDGLSTLSVTYNDTTSYTNGNPIPGGGGGGGGGCPAIEMWLDDAHQVCDVEIGLGLDCLVGEDADFVKNGLVNQTQPVQNFMFTEAPCIHFITESGAEVVVSATTPIPTLEAMSQLAQGAPYDEIAIRAHDIRAGMHVAVEVGNGPEWSMITETISVGMRRIAHIDVGGRTFACGVNPKMRVYTHNLQIVS